MLIFPLLFALLVRDKNHLCLNRLVTHTCLREIQGWILADTEKHLDFFGDCDGSSEWCCNTFFVRIFLKLVNQTYLMYVTRFEANNSVEQDQPGLGYFSRPFGIGCVPAPF